MNTHRHWFATCSTALFLVLFGVIWLAFAPLQFGGQAAYVIVNGNSMEPLYHRGDLVIIRSQPDYQIGDIVTYRHPQIGPVIHRIIGRKAERFVFKGDHNNFIDPYRPLRSELIGKSWIYLPKVGTVLSQLRTPLNMAILVAVAGGIIMAPMIGNLNQPMARKRGRRQDGQPQITVRQQGSREGLLIAMVGLAIASIALAAFAFSLPLTRELSEDITYQHVGVFSYSAAAPAGVYDSTTIQTGEPLFPQLTSTAAFAFDYQFEADKPTDLHGSYRMVAEVRATNGWRRTIELQPATAFSGSAFKANAVLELGQLQTLMNNFEQQTGLLREQYTLAIIPEVRINGLLAGQALQDRFDPRMEFRLDATQIQLLEASGTDQDPLKPVQAGLLKATHEAPNVITLLFLKLEVPIARWIALGILAVACVIGYLLALRLLLHPNRPNEAAQIQSNYAALLIDVAGGDYRPEERMVEVATIADLAKLAEKSGRMILHAYSGTMHRYILHDDGVCYCYQCAGAEQPVIALPQQDLVAAAQAAPAWQSAFLETLREHGTISEACRSANIGIAKAYEERMCAPAFAQAWTEARITLRESLAGKVDPK